MIYLYTFLAVALVGLIAGIAFARWLGLWATAVAGIVGVVIALVLFWFNKSDSVDDTLIEQIATATPPLISFSFLIGWWIGYAGLRWWRRLGQMNALVVLSLIVAIGAFFGWALVRWSGMKPAVWTGLAISAVGAVLAVRQIQRAEAAPDGWTGIAEALGAAFIVLALIGYWGALGIIALRNRKK